MLLDQDKVMEVCISGCCRRKWIQYAKLPCAVLRPQVPLKPNSSLPPVSFYSHPRHIWACRLIRTPVQSVVSLQSMRFEAWIAFECESNELGFRQIRCPADTLNYSNIKLDGRGDCTSAPSIQSQLGNNRTQVRSSDNTCAPHNHIGMQTTAAKWHHFLTTSLVSETFYLALQPNRAWTPKFLHAEVFYSAFGRSLSRPRGGGPKQLCCDRNVTILLLENKGKHRRIAVNQYFHSVQQNGTVWLQGQLSNWQIKSMQKSTRATNTLSGECHVCYFSQAKDMNHRYPARVREPQTTRSTFSQMVVTVLRVIFLADDQGLFSSGHF